MDPVAHTLFGAALAESGLKRTSRYATATLLASANLPDIDVIAHFAGNDTSLYLRRGWSHGILALVLMPLALAGLIWLWHRWREHRTRAGPPFRWGIIVALSYLGLLSHLLLDWLNTYGVRLLMPFDDRWFYGDTLFIIDPWFWLLTATGVVLARSNRTAAIIGWTLLATLASLLILTTDMAPTAIKALWLAGLMVIVVLRWCRPSKALTLQVTRAGLTTLVLYIGAAYGLARVAESTLADTYPNAVDIQANPTPARPGVHRSIVVEEGYYHIVQRDGTTNTVPRKPPDAIVRQAMQDDAIRGFMTWTRYPYWEVDETDNGWRVRFYDLRYMEPGVSKEEGPGIGYAEVLVPENAVEWPE